MADLEITFLTRAQRVPPRAENDPRGGSPWSDSQTRQGKYSVVTGEVSQTEAKHVRSAYVPPLYCTTDRGCYNLAYLGLATQPKDVQYWRIVVALRTDFH